MNLKRFEMKGASDQCDIINVKTVSFKINHR